jgi:hypothetical protein
MYRRSFDLAGFRCPGYRTSLGGTWLDLLSTVIIPPGHRWVGDKGVRSSLPPGSMCRLRPCTSIRWLPRYPGTDGSKMGCKCKPDARPISTHMLPRHANARASSNDYSSSSSSSSSRRRRTILRWLVELAMSRVRRTRDVLVPVELYSLQAQDETRRDETEKGMLLVERDQLLPGWVCSRAIS